MTGSGDGEKFSATPGRSATRKVPPAARGFAPKTFSYHARISVLLRAEEVDVVQRDWRRLLLVLEQLHLHIIGAHHEGDRRCGVHGGDVVDRPAAWRATSDRVMIGYPPAFTRSSVCRRFVHREPDVVHRRPLAAAGRLLVPEEDEHVRELDDVHLLRTEFDSRAAERVGEELQMRRDVARGDVMMAVDDRPVLRRGI